MENVDAYSSSGNLAASNAALPTSSSSVMTVSLRPEDVQAIVSGLASNPSALAAVTLMIQLDQQPASLTSSTRRRSPRASRVSDTGHSYHLAYLRKSVPLIPPTSPPSQGSEI